MNFSCLSCVLLIGVVAGYPARNGYYPQPAYMIGGYYRNPIFGRSYDFSPQGSMSSVVTRDTVATNSFAGPHQIPSGELPLEEPEISELYTEKYSPEGHQNRPHEEVEEHIPQAIPAAAPEIPIEEESFEVAEDVSTEAPAVGKPTRKVAPKRKAKKIPVKKDDEDDEEDNSGAWPFAGARGIPSYNAFFPITISGGAPSRTRTRAAGAEDEEYLPSGSATAIANSFSTGKGGIASSHATSFGDPYLASMLLRNGMFNFKSKKTPVTSEA